MPAIYAHDLFGVRVRENMDAELAAIANRYNSAYREGLQGPDIFSFIIPGIKTGCSAMVRTFMRTTRLLFSATRFP